MTDEQFHKLAATFGFAPSRALRELLDAAVAQERIVERERMQAEHEAHVALQGRSYEREMQIEVEAEREACAKECEAVDVNPHVMLHHAVVCAYNIRARGNKE